MSTWLKYSLWTLLLISRPSWLYAASTFQVWDGVHLTQREGDPAQIKVDHWEIWLYKADESPTLASNHWGATSKDTVKECVQDLRESQAFERRYEKFFGEGSWGKFTYMNPSRPIAVIYPSVEAIQNGTTDAPSHFLTTDEAEALRQLKKAYKALSAIRSAFMKAEKMAAGPPTQMEALKRDPHFKEYMSVVKNSFETSAKVYQFECHTGPPQLQVSLAVQNFMTEEAQVVEGGKKWFGSDVLSTDPNFIPVAGPEKWMSTVDYDNRIQMISPTQDRFLLTYINYNQDEDTVFPEEVKYAEISSIKADQMSIDSSGSQGYWITLDTQVARHELEFSKKEDAVAAMAFFVDRAKNGLISSCPTHYPQHCTLEDSWGFQ